MGRTDGWCPSATPTCSLRMSRCSSTLLARRRPWARPAARRSCPAIAGRRRTPSSAAAGNVAIVHSTGYTSPIFDRTRLVVAIHDLSFVTHPEFHTEANRAFCVAEVERAARHAAMIIVPSRNTKRDLQQRYGVADE